MTTIDRSEVQQPPPTEALLLRDRFLDDHGAGEVVGTRATSGAPRLGVDAEGVVAVDHGALRLRPLRRPGWGRQGVAYGPYERAPGLALAVAALNGHNASQTYSFPASRSERVRAWIADARRGRFRHPRHHENLAVGWFGSTAPRDPLTTGNGFVMHAADGDNGELWVGAAGRPLRAVRGVQNVPILYVVVLRERGAAYYASATPGTRGLGAHPHLRPLGIDVADHRRALYAGVHQRILGEVGYLVDTRVRSIEVAHCPELAAWCGTADVADRFTGTGALGAAPAERGGSWVVAGEGECTAAGLRSGAAGLEAMAAGPAAAGLVHVVLAERPGSGSAGIVFRSGPAGAWSVVVGARGCELAVRDGDGPWTVVARSDRWRLRGRRDRSLQVLDDGEGFGVHLDGELVFDRWFADDRHAAGVGVGVRATPGFGGLLRDLEAHPQAVPVPAPLEAVAPWTPPPSEPVLVDALAGPAGDLADGRGAVAWERSEGVGTFVRGPRGAEVVGDCDEPNPGRTIYTTAWSDPGYVDVSVEVEHPERCGHPGHGARGGLVLWQDPDHYLVVNLYIDATFEGASISTFYHLRGEEEMHHAVWTLVPGVLWGGRNELRVAFDGTRFLATLDGHPSLERALTDVYPDAAPLAIRRIGLIANWEWGDDTGSAFRDLTVRRAVRDGSGAR